MVEPERGHDFAAAVRRQARRVPENQDANLDMGSMPLSCSQQSSPSGFTPSSSPKRSRPTNQLNIRTLLLSLLSASPTAMAACIPLQGSAACSAFQSASVSTDPAVVGLLYVTPAF